MGPSVMVGSPPTSFSSSASPSSKKLRRSSYEVLQGLAGPDSSLPLPRRDINGNEFDGIREGIPMLSPTSYKRMSSPTRTLSRASLSLLYVAQVLRTYFGVQEYQSHLSVSHSLFVFNDYGADIM